MTISHLTSLTGRFSLMPQILGPIILAEVLLLAFIVGWYSIHSLERIKEQASSRAEIIAQTFERRSRSETDLATLSRIAESIAANRDVAEITLLDATSQKVLVSNKTVLVGANGLSHPDAYFRAEYPRARSLRQQQGVFRGSLYYLFTPTHVASIETSRISLHADRFNGLIVTTLDLTDTWRGFRNDLIVFALAGGLLVCITILLIYALLYYFASQPLMFIRHTMQSYTQGQRNITAQPLTSAEFNEVGTSLTTMLTRLTENETQLSTFATQMKNLKEDMQTARDEALHANRMKSEFMATMSHEIRTPMNGVIGMSDLLLESGLSGKQAHYARTVQQSAESLLSLIDDILDFSKIEAGKVELEHTPFHLTALCEGIGDILAVKARDKGLEIVINLDPSLPQMLVGDSARLRQVLVNLVGNAIKFTRQGYVMLSATLAAPVPTEGWQEGAVCPVLFQVKDTGIGIPPEAQSRVFDKFVQADASTTRKYGGTGLGLAICRQLVSLMGGHIGLESRVNEGSTFTLSLTLPVGPQREVPSTYPHLAGKTVLVVDDLPVNLTVIASQLSQLGIRSRGMLNAKQALDEAQSAATRKQPYDLVLIDYLLPGRSGEQLGTDLRALPAYAHTPLVMMTATDSQGYQRRFAEQGFAALLSKPFGLNILAETLTEALSGNSYSPLSTQPTLTRGCYQGKRALVADDNRSNREYIAALLQEMGFEVTEAGTGIEAIAAVTQATASNKPIHIALLDCEMPELDGRTATRTLRESFTPAELPILALTGHTEASELQSCMAAGMNACLAKPLRKPELDTALLQWLPPQTEESHPLEGRTIMLVEDNRFNREYLTELLTGCGATVHTAENGLECLRVLGNHPYIDSILMDCQMPEMDGYQATERIRERQAQGEWTYIPIIALTANAMKGDREKCLAVGMDDYLSKPVNRKQLLTTLEHWFTHTHTTNQQEGRSA